MCRLRSTLTGRLWVAFAALVLLLSLILPSAAQVRAKRLILKDGSFQLAAKWEIKGERIRYYSAERFEWEELPKSLVDWPATEKYERDRQAGVVSEETRQESAEETAERQTEEAKSPIIAPGLRLPASGGVFLLDRAGGQEQLVELVQSGGEINKNMGKNILRAVLNPFAVSSKQSIELKGARARVQAHQNQPVLYVNVEADDSSQPGAKKPLPPEQRFRIIKAQPRKDTRVVGNLKIYLTGKVSEQRQPVETTSQSVSDGWQKVAPAAPLEPGEYALVEMLGPKEMNLYVWDFGVDPRAPANPTAWKPAQPEKTQTGTNQTPVLQPRPKL